MPKVLRHIDYILLLSIVPLLLAGLIAMKSFADSGDYFFNRQIVWIAVSFAVFFAARAVDWRILKSSHIILILYGIGLLVLGALFLGERVRGVASWINLGLFSVEPAEPMKLLTILILAKYFARRHVAIANIKHILISAVFAALPAGLILLQPDLGSALIFGCIWLGMVSASGISKKHLALAFIVCAILFLVGWEFVLAPYQKLRILIFLNPLLDPLGSGYSAIQAMVTVGAGQLLGKGIGRGTQSRLEFLPEHETDFIFAAYAEEWGFVGVLFLLLFFGMVLWRILKVAFVGHGNFEKLFSIGMATMIFSHIFIHVGMNMGVAPITGITLPFMSYGGSALVVIFAGLGMLDGMRRYSMEMPGIMQKNAIAEGI